MWPFISPASAYRPLAAYNLDEEDESIDFDNEYTGEFSPKRASSVYHTWVIASLALGFTVTLAVIAVTQPWAPKESTTSSFINSDSSAPSPCPRRLAWHTLDVAQKAHYISSVRCLLDQPTSLSPNTQPENHTSLYSDFPFIHAHLGYATHHVAPFLPWHRYFLHVYETALRSKCGYQGEGLVYWDWSSEWEDLPHSSVFDAATGFGGDGNGDPDAKITAGNNGRCLTTGPFQDIVANFYDVAYKPHCLSRGFRDDQGTKGVIDGHLLSPENVEDVSSAETYDTFVKGMEERLHDAIPFGVGGDFETFTAPYDPLFFLHHTQLDRLWWLWQERQSPERLSDYSGPKKRHSREKAQLSDSLNYGGINGMPDVAVRDVMDTQAEDGLLCYRY